MQFNQGSARTSSKRRRWLLRASSIFVRSRPSLTFCCTCLPRYFVAHATAASRDANLWFWKNSNFQSNPLPCVLILDRIDAEPLTLTPRPGVCHALRVENKRSGTRFLICNHSFWNGDSDNRLSYLSQEGNDERDVSS